MGFWTRLFARDPKELFLTYSPLDSKWRMVSWNFDLKSPEQRQWLIELISNEKTSIDWRKDKQHVVQFGKGRKLLGKNHIAENDKQLMDLMNLAIHSTIKFGLEENHEFMLTPVSGVTAIDMQNEMKALQWIEASFGTLMRALDKIKQDSSLILTAAFFSGLEPESGERVLRLVAMNLDIFFYMRPDFALQIAIFDDKGQGHGTSRTPTFQQLIKVTKPQFYDQIVKLVNSLAVVGEVK